VTKILAALLSFTALSFAQKLETGAINGAAFRIDVPANWNGSLVVYCHGYNPQPVKYNDQKLPPFLQVFVDQGFAIAQSGYAAGGWAIQEAAVDTESVRRYFIGKYGRPKETYITGHSMGGFLTMMLMETNPTSYDAGLPLCGPLAATTWFMSRAAFDGLVLFNYFFPRVLPDPDKIPKDFVNNREIQTKVEEALNAAPEKSAMLRRQNNLKNNHDLATDLTFAVYMIKELMERAGGNPFDNRNVIYNGTGDDNALNAAIPRYTGSPRAIAYLRSYYTPTGRILNPMLAVHTSYDPLVPVSIPNMYSSTVETAGTERLFVQKYVKHDGHCNIQPDEISRAFAELREWKNKGERPQGGEVLKTATNGNN
jgi:hypothetical protein